jgi:hypothetical protein
MFKSTITDYFNDSVQVFSWMDKHSFFHNEQTVVDSRTIV